MDYTLLLAEAWYRKDFWIFEVWQIGPLLLLIGLIIFWRSYRNRQL